MGELGQVLHSEADVAEVAALAGVPDYAFKVGETVMLLTRPEVRTFDSTLDPADVLGPDGFPD